MGINEMENDCIKFRVSMCSVLISILPSPHKNRSRKLHLFLLMGLREWEKWVYGFHIFTLIRGWQYISGQMKPITKEHSHKSEFSPSIPCALCSTRAEKAPPLSPSSNMRVPFLLRNVWESFRFYRIIHFLPAGKYNYNLSHCKVLKLFHSLWRCQNSWLKLFNQIKVSL